MAIAATIALYIILGVLLVLLLPPVLPLRLVGILMLLALPAFVPVRVRLAFQEEFSVELQYLFLKKKLPPLENTAEEEPESPEKEEEEKLSKKDGEGKKAMLKRLLTRKGISGFLQSLGELIRLVGGCSARLLRRLKLRQFDLYLCLAGAGDAAGAALLYGKVSAGVYGACGGLFAQMPCKDKGITVDMDYTGVEHRVVFSAVLSFRPAFLVKEGAVLLFGALPPVWRVFQLLRPPKAPRGKKA
ncbi:hypothetical protein [Acutalibacter intestini]|uniref:hypothetical protein n=1 Tax=Acutalibacter intestini TaxID=3093659 RepID=UPI002AC9BA30|nr:hypothetical protein [Acutalibacter sp. M00204]